MPTTRLSIAHVVTSLAVVFASSLACQSGDVRGVVSLTVGPETDAWTRDPRPVHLIVKNQLQPSRVGGNPTSPSSNDAPILVEAALPQEEIDLGTPAQGTSWRLRVEALGADGAALLTGSSVPVSTEDLAGKYLSVFVGRVHEFSRLPGTFTSRDGPVLAAIGERFIVAAGGSRNADIYDLLNLSPLRNPPQLPRVPKSIVALGTRLLLIDDAGATWFDLSDSGSGTGSATPPPDATFSDVAGGATIVDDSGNAYVVGGTRLNGPSNVVLRVDPNGTLSWVRLSTERSGAAAIWVPGAGIVVAGGSDAVPPVEILPSGSDAAFPLPFPPDATREGALLWVAGSTNVGAVVLGSGTGDGTARAYDLACRSNCVPGAWASWPALHLASITPLAKDAVLFGERADGSSAAFRLTEGKVAADLPLRVPRRHASMFALGTRALVVGGSETMEVVNW